MLLLRVGHSNERVTQHQIYEASSGRKIYDDNNCQMHCSNNPEYWEDVTDGTGCGVFVKQDNEEKVMQVLEIKETILINTREADSLSIEEYIELISGEQKKIDKLGLLDFKSTAIARIKAKHRSNIDRLVILMDENCEEKNNDKS